MKEDKRMKKLAIISTIILGLATASCDSYLDINQDPNSPTEGNMSTSIMLPAAEMGIAATSATCSVFPQDTLHSTTHTCSVHPTMWTTHSSTCRPCARVLPIRRSTAWD